METQTSAGLAFVFKTLLSTSLTRLLWPKEVDHAIAFTAIEEEEVPVWSISLGESLEGKTREGQSVDSAKRQG